MGNERMEGLREEMKRMDIAEFRALGFLQEVNRQFFHPLGLALEVVTDDLGRAHLGGVWDCRDSVDGIIFFHPPDKEKAARVEALRQAKAQQRIAKLGYEIQPVE